MTRTELFVIYAPFVAWFASDALRRRKARRQQGGQR